MGKWEFRFWLFDVIFSQNWNWHGELESAELFIKTPELRRAIPKVVTGPGSG